VKIRVTFEVDGVRDTDGAHALAQQMRKDVGQGAVLVDLETEQNYFSSIPLSLDVDKNANGVPSASKAADEIPF